MRNHNDQYLLLACVAILATFYFLVPTPPAAEKPEALFIQERFLQAKYALAIDLTTDEVLYEKSPDEVVPLASLAKVMTAIVAAENIPKDEKIYISERAIKEEGANGLTAGSYWNRDDLISFMLVESSNDAAYAIAETLEKDIAGANFASLMNQKAAMLNLNTFRFYTVNGLDQNGVPGAVGSARDVAGLLKYAWQNHSDIFASTTQKEVAIAAIDEDALLAENSNKAILAIPGRVLSKTGMTALAGGNLGVIVEKGPLHPIIVVVLGSTEYGRFSDVETIVEKIFKN